MDKFLGDNFKSNGEDFLDFLTSLKCFKAPSKNNIEAIIFELAHQKLMQKPRYEIKCWSPVLMVFHSENFQSLEKLDIFYQSKEPTAKKINKLF